MHLPPVYNIITLGKEAFYKSMNLNPETEYGRTIIAVWNTIIYAAAIVACLACPPYADGFGRKHALALGGLVSLFGAALQAGSTNISMLVAARVFVGAGIGVTISCVPLYQAEISPPANRGIIVGLHASMIGFGTLLATWLGVAFFHVPGSAGWRVPMAIQCVPALALTILAWLIPESPRWLCMQDRAEEAEAVLIKLHKRSDDPQHLFARQEMAIIRRQLEYEKMKRVPVLQAFKQPSLRKRFIIGFLAFWNTQCSGVIVVLAYQSVIYQSLGFSPFLSAIIGAAWASTLFWGNLLGGILGDYVGRKKQFTVGLFLMLIVLICLCVTTKLYSGTDNRAGKIAAVVLHSYRYTVGIECPSLVYCSELFPTEWRAWGVANSLSAVLWGCMIFTAAAPSALDHIGALYYVVFICLTAVQIVLVLAFFPDTKGFTLEQMSAVFGDPVVDMYGKIEKGEDFVRHHQRIEDAKIEKATEVEDVGDA
ncbi:hypothetical protein H2200_006514 [Cladophialophora chaetospira]|uniref:Major facilitator superfamily (MFS) profile domain-containing protein n=1 Tax=Cladophialophora chaetospira TaxID=386627 RepID=A0AA39CHS9_9EURO|nr:hypothetical protein H2200_006514 [Cladophialophora chaetospira]